jgi:hypothetical protein
MGAAWDQLVRPHLFLTSAPRGIGRDYRVLTLGRGFVDADQRRCADGECRLRVSKDGPPARKAAVVISVLHSWILREEACRRYQLSKEENGFTTYGDYSLRSSRLQQYRCPAARRGR